MAGFLMVVLMSTALLPIRGSTGRLPLAIHVPGQAGATYRCMRWPVTVTTTVTAMQEADWPGANSNLEQAIRRVGSERHSEQMPPWAFFHATNRAGR